MNSTPSYGKRSILATALVTCTATVGLGLPIACAQTAPTAPAFVMPTIAPPAVPNDAAWTQPGTTVLSASHSQLSNLRVAEGRLLARGSSVPDVVLEDIEARDFGPILRGSGLTGARFERLAVRNGRGDGVYGLGIVNLSGPIGNLATRDLVYAGDPAAPAPNSADAWGAITLKGKGSTDTGTFVIDRFEFRNLYMASGAAYPNVDGISTESGHSGSITNGLIDGASDACLDLKGDVRVDNVRLANCRQGLKLWSDQRHGLIEMGTHRFVSIIGKGNGSGPVTLHIDTLIMTGEPGIPLFRAESGIVNLTIGTLVARPNQTIEAGSSFQGSTVTIGQRINVN